MGKYLNTLIERKSLLNEISENYILEDQNVKSFSDNPTLTSPQKVQKSRSSDGGDVLALLARYRRGGAVLELETVTHDGSQWRALACELSGVAPHRRDHAFAQMQRHARRLQSALEAEAQAGHEPP